MNVRAIFYRISFVVIVAIGGLAYFLSVNWLWLLLLFGPIIILGITNVVQDKQTIKKNFPVIGNFRYALEKIRPEIMQYFVETDTEGRPFNRLLRSVVYRRAKKVNDTVPFGTQMDVYKAGYEWMDHSIYAHHTKYFQKQPRVLVGGPDCKQPYLASILNVSAMSYGSLSKNAVAALSKGAKQNKFALNTGEGGISPYHEMGGDIIYQIGTGYFGCRSKDGGFSREEFVKKASKESVKMIEVKISQGAKETNLSDEEEIKEEVDVKEVSLEDVQKVVEEMSYRIEELEKKIAKMEEMPEEEVKVEEEVEMSAVAPLNGAPTTQKPLFNARNTNSAQAAFLAKLYN